MCIHIFTVNGVNWKRNCLKCFKFSDGKNWQNTSGVATHSGQFVAIIFEEGQGN